MKMHLIIAAAAASILLTSAANAAHSSSSSSHVSSGVSNRGGTGPEGTPRAGSRYTVMTDNEQLMCKVAGNPSGDNWAPPTAWAQEIAHMHREGDIRCTPAMMNH
jgi:hypothetical protein